METPRVHWQDLAGGILSRLDPDLQGLYVRNAWFKHGLDELAGLVGRQIEWLTAYAVTQDAQATAGVEALMRIEPHFTTADPAALAKLVADEMAKRHRTRGSADA